MVDAVRMSKETFKVLGALLDDPGAWHFGLQLSKEAGVASGTIYPVLARLEKAGWLESQWENPASEGDGHPRRRLYRLTGVGQRVAMEELEEIAALARRAKRRRHGLAPKPKEA